MATRRTPTVPAVADIPTGPIHPVLSALQFAADTREYGGASMNAHTGENVLVGRHGGYAVGGARNSFTGDKVETRKLPIHSSGAADISPDVVLAHRASIAKTAPDDPNRLMGSWDARGSKANPRNEIDIDASDQVKGRRQAKRAGKRRSEDAIFGIKAGKDIRTNFPR